MKDVWIIHTDILVQFSTINNDDRRKNLKKSIFLQVSSLIMIISYCGIKRIDKDIATANSQTPEEE